MKKAISVLLCLLMLTAAVSVPAAAEGNPLLPYAMEMIADLHELAGDEIYLNAMMVDADFSLADALAATDCSDFRCGYQLTVQEILLEPYLNLQIDYNEMSEPGKKAVSGMILNTASNQWNARKSTTALALSGILSCGGIFAEPEGFEKCMMIIDCGGALYCVSFTECAEGFISGRMSPLFTGEGETVETVLQFIVAMMPLFIVTPVTP